MAAEKIGILQRIAGAKVAWKELGEVATYHRGLTYKKSHESKTKEGLKVLRANNISLQNNALNFDGVKVIKYQTSVKDEQKLYKNDILICAASGSKSHVGKVAFIAQDLDYYFGGFMGVIRAGDGVLPQFLYHLLTSDLFKNYLDDVLQTSTINNLNSSVMRAFKLPLPPLPLQQEIAALLDKFSALTAQLTNQLSKEQILRQQQYRYYRNRLLDFAHPDNPFAAQSGAVVWRELGEIGKISMCKRILKSQTVAAGDIPFYKIGTFGKTPDAYISQALFDDYKAKYSYPKAGDVLISASGTIGRTVIFDGKDAYFQDSNIVWIDNDESQVLNKFLFYYYKDVDWNSTIGGTISRLYNHNLAKIQIPLPPLSLQQEIIALLDKFERLAHSLDSGLPREIALRQKQYRYYREKLLDFGHLNAH